jgi:hypothetical protein
MTITDQLLKVYRGNNTQIEQFEALYTLRTLINEVDTLDLFCAVELLLSTTEDSLLEVDKDYMRKQEYQFREDLDDVPEMFRNLELRDEGDDYHG